MRNLTPRRRRSLLTVFVMSCSLLFIASPAGAYDERNLSYPYAYVDTDNCSRLAGGLSVSDIGGYCFLNDAADDTYFRKDANATATKEEIRSGGELVAKVEFHPYDEILWVYDTKNDGDTIYVTIRPASSPREGAPISPPGTDNPIDIRRLDLSYDDGTKLLIRVYDDEAGNEFLGELYPVA